MDESQPQADFECNGLDDPLALLRTQDSLYAELESLASRQRTLITGGDTGPLLVLLADRQRLSSKLSILAEQLRPIRRDWIAYRDRLPSGDRDEADRLLKVTQKRLQHVIETDEQDARLLGVRKAAASSTLRAVHSTSQAVSAYRVSTGSATRLDRMDEESA